MAELPQSKARAQGGAAAACLRVGGRRQRVGTVGQVHG